MNSPKKNSVLSRFVGNVFAGLFLMLPVSVVIIVAFRIYQMAIVPVRELALNLGIERPNLVKLLLLFLLVVVCFIAGVLMHARIVSNFRDMLENTILRFVPSYEYVRMRLVIMAGKDEKSLERAVLVKIDDGWSPAMLIEEDEDGICTVFVPDVPKSNSGSVYVVEPEQVKHLNVRFNKLDLAIRNYGRGLNKIYKDSVANSVV